MALPRGAGNLAGEAKKIAEKVSQPITNKIDDVRQTVGTKEGLKGIAFNAGGRDPVVGISTGIALGIGALGVGLGAKGLQSAFKGVKRLIGGLPKADPSPNDSSDTKTDMSESLDSMDDLMKTNVDQNNLIGQFKDQTKDILDRILSIGEKQLFLSESVLTNAARQRLEDARAESERIETSREAARFQKKMLAETIALRAANNDVKGGDPGKSPNVLKDVFFGKSLFEAAKFAILGIFIGLPKKISGILGKSIPKFGKTLFKILGKVFVGGLLKLKIAGIFLGIGLSLAEGIGDAIESFSETGNLKKAIGNFFTGTIGMLTSFFSFGLINKDKTQQFLNDILPKIGNFIVDTLKFLTKGLISAGAFLIDNIKIEILQFGARFAFALADIIPVFKDGIEKLFKKLIESVRVIVVEQTKEIPVIGESIAKQFMTPEERVVSEQKRQRTEVVKTLNDIREERKKVIDSTPFLFGGEARKQKRIEKLNSQEIDAKRELRNLQKVIAPPPIQSPKRQKEIVNTIKKESLGLVAKQSTGNVVVSAPATISNVTNQSVTNSMVSPIGPVNTESSVSRAFGQEF